MKDKQMQIRKVEVIWSRGDIVFVRGDLRLGEAVVTSRIVTPIEGMLLYTKDDEPAAPRGRSEGEEAS
jgi:hypothetical protein